MTAKIVKYECRSCMHSCVITLEHIYGYPLPQKCISDGSNVKWCFKSEKDLVKKKKKKDKINLNYQPVYLDEEGHYVKIGEGIETAKYRVELPVSQKQREMVEKMVLASKKARN